MKLLFYLALILLVTYLIIDVVLVGEGSDRPIVQILAGVGLVSMLGYNLSNFNNKFALSKRWRFIKLWYIFVGLIIVYFLLSLVNIPTDLTDPNLRNLVVPIYILSTIFFIYYGVINNHLTQKLVYFLLIVLVFNGIMEVYNAVINPRIKFGVEVINTSAGYVFVMILPLLMYIFRKENFWVFAITLILTLMTGKRGALVIYFILALYFIFRYKYLRSEFKVTWKTISFLILSFIAYYIFIENALESLVFRLFYLDEYRGTVGSGRADFWLELWHIWLNSDFLTKIFGYGFYATRTIINIIAHNDFLDFLVNFGIPGLLMWVYVLLTFYRNVKNVHKYDPYLHLLLMICLIVLVGRGTFAGTLRTDNINLSISIGYILGIVQLKKISAIES